MPILSHYNTGLPFSQLRDSYCSSTARQNPIRHSFSVPSLLLHLSLGTIKPSSLPSHLLCQVCFANIIISFSPPSSHPPLSSSSKCKRLLNASISLCPLQKQKKLFLFSSSSYALHWEMGRRVYCCSNRLNRTKGACFCQGSSFLGPSNALIVSKWQ